MRDRSPPSTAGAATSSTSGSASPSAIPQYGSDVSDRAGSAAIFFDKHPRFLETSTVAAHRVRLNLRYRAIFEQNSDLLAGASVLDMASHDGRWTYAALAAGAASVVGVEARPELVAAAESNLSHYDAPPERYEFVTADLFDYLAEPAEFDVVLCLGFFYHTLRFSELLAGIRSTGARYVVVDTRALPVEQEFIRLVVDQTEKQGHAVGDPAGHASSVLTGTPSPAALARMFEVYGFDVHRKVDWTALAGKASGVAAYRQGRRLTWTFERR